eukprot:SAG11_NODE_1615_length_4578_cov_6.001786_2_plen_375_part_00
MAGLRRRRNCSPDRSLPRRRLCPVSATLVADCRPDPRQHACRTCTLQLVLLPLSVLHFGGAGGRVAGVGHYLQFANRFMTVLPMPLLPFLLSPTLAQNLILWKLGIDLLAAGVLVLTPSDVSAAPRVGLTVLRAGLFVLVPMLWIEHILAHSYLLVGWWDLFVGVGFVVRGSMSRKQRRQRRRLRFPLHDAVSLCSLSLQLSGSNDMSGGTSGLEVRIRMYVIAKQIYNLLAVLPHGARNTCGPYGESPLLRKIAAPRTQLLTLNPWLLCQEPPRALPRYTGRARRGWRGDLRAAAATVRRRPAAAVRCLRRARPGRDGRQARAALCGSRRRGRRHQWPDGGARLWREPGLPEAERARDRSGAGLRCVRAGILP